MQTAVHSKYLGVQACLPKCLCVQYAVYHTLNLADSVIWADEQQQKNKLLCVCDLNHNQAVQFKATTPRLLI